MRIKLESTTDKYLDGNIDQFIEEGIKLKKIEKIISLSKFNFFALIIILLVTLSTIGIETSRFNNFIKRRFLKKYKFRLEIIRFKIDPKLSLF